MQRVIVDLPEPEGPQTTTRSPFLTSRSMPLRTWKSPYHLSTWRSWMIGSLARVSTALSVILPSPPLTPPAFVELALEHLDARTLPPARFDRCRAQTRPQGSGGQFVGEGQTGGAPALRAYRLRPDALFVPAYLPQDQHERLLIDRLEAL